MYPPTEAIIHPDNRDHIRRLFVMDGVEEERLRNLAAGVMEVYAKVTGKEFSKFDRQDYPGYIVDKLHEQRHFELRFGMPNLRGSARDHGKLWGMTNSLYLPEGSIRVVGFWADTNDSDYAHPQSQASQAVEAEFDLEVKALADSEYSDISVPAPRTATQLGYNPSEKT